MIRKKIRRNLAILIASTLISSTFIGCTNIALNNISNSESDLNQVNGKTLLGQVTSIDGSKITIALGEEKTSDSSTSDNKEETESQNGQSQEDNQIPEGTPPNTSVDNSSKQNHGDDSAPPIPPDNQSQTDGGTPPSKPNSKGQSGGGTPQTPPDNQGTDSNNNGNPPSGSPGGNGDSKSKNTFTLTGEEKTIDITDDSIITVEKGSKTLSGTLEDISIGEILSFTYDDSGNISSVLVKSNNSTYTGGSQTGNITLSGSYTVDGDTKTSNNEEISSNTSDQTAILVTNEGSLEIKDAEINKSGDTTSSDESNFYAINSGVVASKAGSIAISDSTVNTDSEGSNAIFATGDGSLINVSNVTINTTKNASRGLDATYNGTIIAENTNIATQGDHCAALATDRGEGTIHATGGTMNTYGSGSPAIYSTGNITATNATLTAAGSQAAVIEGKNSITVNNCTLTGSKNNGVMLYQSFSGDSGVGTSYFNMTDGTLTALEGPMFYVTNTDAQVNLKNATLKTNSGILINSATGKWGKEGSNGGNLTLNATSQILEGDVTCDDISTVMMNLKNNSSLNGKINSDNVGKSVGISLDETSTWTVTGTSYLTIIKDSDTNLSNINDNGNTIYYDSSNSENNWLDGKTITLSGGGTLTPMK